MCDTLTREERLGVATSLQNDKSIVESYIHKEIVDGDKDKGLAGSTDVGDVSYVIPVAQFAMGLACWNCKSYMAVMFISRFKYRIFCYDKFS